MAERSPPPSGERYEPLPGLAALPGWIWRRLPVSGRVVVALLPVLAIALLLLLGPGIERGKEERSRAEAERLAQARAARTARIREEQRPRFGRGRPAGPDLAARERLLDAGTLSVARDARRRVATGALSGPIRRIECEPFPRTTDRTGAHERPGPRYGRYACLAVTSAFAAGKGSEAGAVGHPYRLRVDFETGAFAFCKLTGRAAEGALGTQPVVAVSRSCGGS
jgi:hypothetical protein